MECYSFIQLQIVCTNWVPGTVQSIKEKRAKVDMHYFLCFPLYRIYMSLWELWWGKSWRDVFIYNGKWLEAMIQIEREKAWPRCREQVTGYPVVLFIFVSWWSTWDKGNTSSIKYGDNGFQTTTKKTGHSMNLFPHLILWLLYFIQSIPW